MSVPTNSLTVKEWWTYAEHLAANHTAIAHVPDSHPAFARSSFPEANGAEFNGLNSPCLIAEAPESEGIDNASNNLLSQRYLAWTIAKRMDVLNSTPSTRIDAELDCETIALEVLARLRAERIHRDGKVFADVKMNEWKGDIMSPFLPAGWVGYRIMVPVQVNDLRLKFNEARWTDTVQAIPLMRDVTGFSCANLNHPTLGLSQAQRLQCVLPGYDFSQTTTQNALSDAQVTALEEWLGSGGSFDPVTIYRELADGTAEQYTTLNSGGEYTDGRVAILNSATSTAIEWLDGGADMYQLRDTELYYRAAGGGLSSLLVRNASINGSDRYATPDGELGAGDTPIPRFTVFRSDGTTVRAQRDINNPTYTEQDVSVVVNTADPIVVAPGATLQLLAKDQDGNTLAITLDGNTITVAMPQAILYFETEAEALTNDFDVPTVNQMVSIGDTKRLYPGDGVLNINELITAKVYNPSVREEAGKGIRTTFEGAEYEVQLNTL